MKKIKSFILVLIISGSLLFLFVPEVSPENLQFQENLNSAIDSDIIIIFNSGGWGNTPLEEAKDFAPIVEEIEKTLNQWGYSSLVIPFERTKESFLGKMTGVKEFFNSFENSSELLVEKIELIIDMFPDKKIIITGLSNGGAFCSETMEKNSQAIKGFSDKVFAIAVGVPFWHKRTNSENILYIDNGGKDALAVGKIKPLIFSLFSENDAAITGHYYQWDSPEVGPQIVAFLEEKL